MPRWCGCRTGRRGWRSPSTSRRAIARPIRIEGGKQAVAEAWRNITAVGGRPLAITDNLNFGNPERPEIMGQFVGCLKGIAEACRALDFPVVSGNVSLYNETNGRGILPTPSIGGVGLLDDFTKSATLAFKAEGEAILLIGETHGWLGQSVYLRDICGREEGAPPPVDLAAEKRNGDVVRGMIHAGTATAVHDVSDGGLLVALAEMAIASGIGAQLLAAPAAIVPHAYWFGEDQARYIVTVRAEEAGLVLAKMKGADVPCVRIGTTGGDSIAIAGEAPVSIASLKAGFEGWFPGLYERQGVLDVIGDDRLQAPASRREFAATLAVAAQLNATVSTNADRGLDDRRQVVTRTASIAATARSGSAPGTCRRRRPASDRACSSRSA